MFDDKSYNINVLLVDNDKGSYTLTNQLFKKFTGRNFILHWVDSFEAALAEMRLNNFDVYLLDYRLQNKTGFDLLREARQSGCRAPIIFLTSESDKQVIVEAFRAGAVDYLIKGEFDAAFLEQSISYAVEKDHALQAFQESEDKYFKLIETLPLMFYSVEPTAPYAPFYVSPSFASFGYPLEKWTDNPDTWLNAIHPEDRERIIFEIEDAISGGGKTDFSYRLIRADGKIRQIQDQGRIVKDENGQTTCWQGFMIDVTDHKLVEEALAENEERYRTLFENAKDIVYIHDLEGNYISINPAAERIFGYSVEELCKMNRQQIIAPEQREYARRKLREKIADSKQPPYELTFQRKDGERVQLELSSFVIYKNGVPVHIQGIARDITERKMAEESLKKSEERYRELFENAHDLIYTHDLQGNFTSLNRAGEIITGYSRDEALQMNFSEILVPEYLRHSKLMISDKMLGRYSSVFEVEIISKNGQRVALELSTTLIESEGKPLGIQGIARDVTDRKKAQDELKHHALYDTLTCLPNRTQFMTDLKAAIRQSADNPTFRFGVLFLDLDRFKVINDSLGHLVGDKLLVAIAERVKNSLRSKDIVARLGGDEFTILVNKITDVDDAVLVAERLQRVLSKPFKIENYEIFTSASIGIVISDENSRNPQEILRDADTAMYQAKESGKARYEIFDREMHVHNLNLLQIETDLRNAVKHEEFEVYYQPIINLDTLEIIEFEALIRWKHPETGLISPNDFICVAEETGLIVPMGKWILEEAAWKTREWQLRYGRENELSISVNLSAKQLLNPHLVEQVKHTLEKSGLSPNCLKLEVTESIVMENVEKSIKVLSELHQMGITFSTDDFGTGYSSLSYLHRFPFERLKIDRSFVSKMDSDSKSAVIVRTLMMLGENLNIGVVAEGIENKKQLAQLKSLGCKIGQGFYFSKPVNAQTAEELLRNGLPKNIDSPPTNLIIPKSPENQSSGTKNFDGL